MLNFLLNYMAARQEKDGEFFYKHNTDSEGRPQNIFWADAPCRMEYDAFGGVVVFDSTYRVNKYNLPFVPFIGVNHHRSTTVFGFGIVSDEKTKSYVWLLEAFLESAQQNHPRSVITDGDHAMARAISKVFPNADHRLCSWHIEQNMIRHLRKTKLSDFRKFVYYYRNVDEFESRWADFLEEYEISEKDAWINRMYELRKKWSRAYTKDRYFLGMQSNQRSESLNSRIHKNLDRRMSLADLLEHTDHCLWRIRKNEAELDARASQTVPFTELDAEPLLRSSANIYTPVMFKKVKQQIDQLPKWGVAKVTKQDAVVVYAVALKERRDAIYDVKLTMAGPMLQGVNCRCLKMETEEIPCTHIFSVLKFLGLISVPSCCISRRWTMLAKPAFESERKANMHDWSERMDRYHNLRNRSNLFLFNAASSPEKSQKVLDFLESLTPDVGEDNSENKAASFGPLPAYFSGADQTFTGKVLDPKKIIPKGGPSKNNKRWKPMHETWKTNK
jgi:zinc finger SWIM domain-containing protein 3